MLKLFFQLIQPLSLILVFGVANAPLSLATEDFPTDTPREQVCNLSLEAGINQIVNRPEWRRSRWGILIQTLDTEETLYSLNAEKYFLPASNVKLFTTAATLLRLGADYRILTPVYGTGNLPNLNTLRLVGRGDPSLTTAQLEDLAQQLKARGVKSIRELIVDDSYFPQPGINSSWEWSDIFYYYATNVNSLILNENAVILKVLPQELGESVELIWSDTVAAQQWRVENKATTAPEGTDYSITINGVFGVPILKIGGELAVDASEDIWGIAVVDPANYFWESWRHILLAAGIQVKRGRVIHNSEFIPQETELAVVESPPVAQLIQKINQESNNLFAEAFLKLLTTSSDRQTPADTFQRQLTELGLDPEGYHLADGSGLSRQNLVSPEALVRLLKLMAITSEYEVFRESLTVAGVNGTLAKRFVETSIAGNFQAKTGTLSGVSALSGYLSLPGQDTLIISLIVNQANQSSSVSRQAIDEIVLLLANFSLCN